MKNWSSLGYMLVFFIMGCGEGAKLVQDYGDSGVVTYPFKGEQGAMLSSFRKEALAMMREKCSGAYKIVREGEVKGRARMAGAIEGAQELVQERRWGIEFRCK